MLSLTLVFISLFSETILITLDQHHILDKTGHFVGFLLLSWIIHYGIKIELFITTSTLILYAGLTEIGQSYLDFRSGQFSDFIADVLGCLFYFMVIKINAKLRVK